MHHDTISYFELIPYLLPEYAVTDIIHAVSWTVSCRRPTAFVDVQPECVPHREHHVAK
jgi:hypothetical protein